MTQLTKIDFHGTTLLAWPGEDPNNPLIAMKPVVEGMGLDWSTQNSKINHHPVLAKGIRHIAIPSGGGLQDTLAIPLNKLNFWLATVNSRKVAPEIRERIELYQHECSDVLFAHFSGTLTSQAKVTLRDVGGVVKAVTHKELMESEERSRTENRAEMAVLKAELAKIAEAYDPTRTVSIMYRLANHYVIQAGVGQKGRRGFTTKCSNRLLKFAGREIPDQPGKNRMHLARTSNESGKWTFHLDLWREWLVVEGNTLIREHKDAQSGQSVLQLVSPKKPV